MTDWLSAAGMLLSGLVIGFMILYAVKRPKPAAAAKKAAVPSPDSAELRDLEAKRDALIRQLRELDDADPDADAERSRLEGEATKVLRELDGVRVPAATAGTATATAAAPAAAPQRAGGLSPAIKGFAWGVLSAAILAGIGWYVVDQSKPREAGQPTTGGTMQPQASAPPQQQAPTQPDAELKALEAAVAKSPDDLKLRNDLAKAYFDRENLMAVYQQTEIILAKAPNDPHALTYQALVRMSMGQNEAAQKMLVTATKGDPSFTDAWVALAWLSAMSHHDTEADAAIAEAIKHHPEQEARLKDVLSQMKAKAAQQPAPQAQPAAAGMAMQSPSSPSAPMQSSAAALPGDSGPTIHITLSVSPGAKIPPAGVIFIIARAAGVTAGPPAAVKRLPLGTFPLIFDLTSADSMMGQPLPAKMRIEARIDSDGNAMTKDPTDLNAVQDGVAPGASITLVAK